MVRARTVIFLLNFIAVVMSLVSAGFMFYLSDSIGEKRLHRIFQRLGYVMIGVVLAVSLGFIHMIYPDHFFLEIWVDIMVIISLFGFMMVFKDVKEFGTEHRSINKKAKKFAKELED